MKRFMMQYYIKMINDKIHKTLKRKPFVTEINRTYSKLIYSASNSGSNRAKIYEKNKEEFNTESFDIFQDDFLNEVLNSESISGEFKYKLIKILMYRFSFDIQKSSYNKFISDLDNIRHLRHSYKSYNTRGITKDMHLNLLRYTELFYLNELKYIQNATHNDFGCYFYPKIEKEEINEIKKNIKSVRRIFYNENMYIEDRKIHGLLRKEHQTNIENYEKFKSVRYSFSNFISIYNSIGSQTAKKIIPKPKWESVMFEELEMLYRFSNEIVVTLWYFFEVPIFVHNGKYKDFSKYKKQEVDSDLKKSIIQIRNLLAHKSTIYEIYDRLGLETVYEVIPYAINLLSEFYRCVGGTSTDPTGSIQINSLKQKLDAIFKRYKIQYVKDDLNLNIRKKYNWKDMLQVENNEQKVVRTNTLKKQMTKFYKYYRDNQITKLN